MQNYKVNKKWNSCKYDEFEITAAVYFKKKLNKSASKVCSALNAYFTLLCSSFSCHFGIYDCFTCFKMHFPWPHLLCMFVCGIRFICSTKWKSTMQQSGLFIFSSRARLIIIDKFIKHANCKSMGHETKHCILYIQQLYYN